VTVELIKSTRSFAQLQIVWDAIIIGAGAAGAFAAVHLAGGKKILLLDKSQFPRAKVCGCCLNASAYSALERAGLGEILEESDALPLTTLELHHGSTESLINLPAGGHALSRNFLDAFLIRKAVSKGADFVCGLTAKVLPQPDSDLVTIEVSASDFCATIETNLVIVADGLNGHSLDRIERFAVHVEKDARFGCGAIVGGAESFENGRVYMCCHPAGYVGLVALEDGRYDIAAALDKEFSKECGGPAKAAEAIFAHCQVSLPSGFSEAVWQGTEALTRKRDHVAGHRIFVIGDACGYPEPFTGEGIAWALRSAEALAPLAQAAMDQWRQEHVAVWQRRHYNLIGARHKRSKLIAYSLRNGVVFKAALTVLTKFPLLSKNLVAKLTGAQAVNRIKSSEEIHC